MYKTIGAALLGGLLATSAFAQSPQSDAFGSDRGAQNSTLTIETVTLRHCEAGYKQDMKFTKQEFDARCAALQKAAK